uniref:Transposase n=1 Tax=Steinernema glaseri TaxID=37863 RepID=A0A1I7YNM6_9BILA
MHMYYAFLFKIWAFIDRNDLIAIVSFEDRLRRPELIKLEKENVRLDMELDAGIAKTGSATVLRRGLVCN